MAEPEEARSRPSISVIVAACDASPDPSLALASLQAQGRAGVAEVLLVDRLDRQRVADPAGGWARCRHLKIPNANLPRLKEAAIRAARADVVAILDSTASAEPEWIGEILAAFDDPEVAAVGGSVSLADAESRTSRALFLFEYGAFNPPLESGPTEGDLPGNNVAYRRSLLLEGCAEILDEEGFNKPFCHQRLREMGGRLVLRPPMAVHHRAPSDFGAVARSRFHYGRCFGATRRRRATPGMRLLYVLGSPLVPILLVARHLRRCRRHPANRRLLAGATAPLVGICLSWGFGEWLGTWFGAAASCGKFR